ncbi:MAG: FHA domain-containing protein [Gemmatimonadota bacterium]|nr:FHA domain-containing protein [Gemmatimonadota bacterium]
MTACTFCGRENDAESRFCIDCGKPVKSSDARVAPAYVPDASGTPRPHPVAPPSAPPASPNAAGVPSTRVSNSPKPSGAAPAASKAVCTRCGRTVDASLPFCAHCGNRVTTSVSEDACRSCGAPFQKGVDMFCARCGARVGERVSVVDQPATGGTQVLGSGRREAGPKLALLNDAGDVAKTFALDRGEAVVGRGEADIKFGDDVYMSPLHARFDLREGVLWVRDLGSRNGSWAFIDGNAKLVDGDRMLIGSQVLRFRRLGYPGPHPPEADSTRRMGSLTPPLDVAVLEQLRADGSVRDTFHLSPGRSILVGRETGDWTFPYDQTMSGRHAEVRSEDSDFFVHDAGSRNGVALAVRGEQALKKGQRLLLGDQILRVESV